MRKTPFGPNDSDGAPVWTMLVSSVRDIKHGTYNAYVLRECRCAECVAAVPHDTIGGHLNWYCYCSRCCATLPALYAIAKQYYPKLKAGQNPTDADFDAAEGRATSAAYAYLLAAILREAPSRVGEEAANDLAALINAVQADGLLAIEEANGDLDEIVYAESLNIGTRVRINRPGAADFDKTGIIAAKAPYSEPNKVGVAIDGRDGVQVYAAYDVTALPQPKDAKDDLDEQASPAPANAVAEAVDAR